MSHQLTIKLAAFSPINHQGDALALIALEDLEQITALLSALTRPNIEIAIVVTDIDALVESFDSSSTAAQENQ